MSYHVLDDILKRVSEERLVQLTNDADGDTIDEDVYAEARADADAEIDGYIGARYGLPLASTPALIKRLSITLTTYHLYRRRITDDDDFPGQVRKDYEDAIRALCRLSDGTVTLGTQPAPAQNPERVGQLESHTRVFSRSTLESF